MKGDVAKLTTKPQRADRALCLIGMVALLFECPVAAAGPLDLDPTFNKGSGKVVTSFQLHPEALAVALSILATPARSSKILVRGIEHSPSQFKMIAR